MSMYSFTPISIDHSVRGMNYGIRKTEANNVASIEKIREISHRCLNDQPLDEELSNWLGNSLQEFLEHSCRTIDEAFGLRFARGGVPWWREEAIRVRDAALRELAEGFVDATSLADATQIVARMSNRYAGSAWRIDRECDEMPAHYAGTPNEFLWRAFRSGATMPIGERQLRNIIAD